MYLHTNKRLHTQVTTPSEVLWFCCTNDASGLSYLPCQYLPLVYREIQWPVRQRKERLNTLTMTQQGSLTIFCNHRQYNTSFLLKEVQTLLLENMNIWTDWWVFSSWHEYIINWAPYYLTSKLTSSDTRYVESSLSKLTNSKGWLVIMLCKSLSSGRSRSRTCGYISLKGAKYSFPWHWLITTLAPESQFPHKYLTPWPTVNNEPTHEENRDGLVHYNVYKKEWKALRAYNRHSLGHWGVGNMMVQDVSIEGVQLPFWWSVVVVYFFGSIL